MVTVSPFVTVIIGFGFDVFQLGLFPTSDMVCVVPLTGGIEGKAKGETYRVNPKIRTRQTKIPAAFVKRMDLSNDAIRVVGYMV